MRAGAPANVSSQMRAVAPRPPTRRTAGTTSIAAKRTVCTGPKKARLAGACVLAAADHRREPRPPTEAVEAASLPGQVGDAGHEHGLGPVVESGFGPGHVVAPRGEPDHAEHGDGRRQPDGSHGGNPGRPLE